MSVNIRLLSTVYSNGVSGDCSIQGFVVPDRVDNIVDCQGTITFTWDTFGLLWERQLLYTQILNILPK